jgi:drug/metabolite transporter (DMT)-like permease
LITIYIILYAALSLWTSFSGVLMIIAILAALAAATCWAVGGLVSITPAQYLGALAFNRVRMIFVFIMLASASILFGGWDDLYNAYSMPLILSGLVGIFIGDTALFAALRRLGPRRTAILFAANAPITALLGIFFLDEHLNLNALIGIALVMSGVVIAIVFGKRKAQLHHWEDVKGPLWIGVAFGVLAASAQAGGLILTKPVLDSGVDPISASAIRVGISALCLILLAGLPFKQFKSLNPLTLNITFWVIGSGFLGMGLGMTLLLYALANGDAGIVATLSATSPVIILPILWMKTKERPALMAWVGAILVGAGAAFLFNG